VFEEDLDKRNQWEAKYLLALSEIGLGNKQEAQKLLEEVLHLNVMHYGANETLKKILNIIMNYKNYMFISSFIFLLMQSCVRDVKKPNIILILADDMGYSDLGCTGSEIETPNLDKLANNGVFLLIAIILQDVALPGPACLQDYTSIRSDMATWIVI
jgi:hypothetical protein